MHIFENFAKNITVDFLIINIACGLFSFLIFPTAFEVYFHLDFTSKRLNFGIYTFKFLKLLSGYITFKNGLIAIHISEKKAIVIKPLESRQTYILRGLEQVYLYELKIAESIDFKPEQLFMLSIYKSLLSYCYPVISSNDNLNFQNVSIIGGKPFVFIKAKFAINVLAIIVILIKSKKVGINER